MTLVHPGAEVVVSSLEAGDEFSIRVVLDSVTPVLAVDVGAAVNSGARVSLEESPRTEQEDRRMTIAAPDTPRTAETRRTFIDASSGSPLESTAHAVHRQVQCSIDVDTHEARTG